MTGVLTKAGAIYGSGAVSASMYGGERVQLEGRFFLPTDEPLIRLTSANVTPSPALPPPHPLSRASSVSRSPCAAGPGGKQGTAAVAEAGDAPSPPPSTSSCRGWGAADSRR